MAQTPRPSLRSVAIAALLAGTCLTAPHALAKVGVAAAVNQDARGTPPGGSARVISIGKSVVFNERVDTSGEGLVQVLLLDGTTFTVGPNASLVIDKFVYDPSAGTAEVSATIAKGAFRMIGGVASKREGGATLRTPGASIGIRGGMVEGVVDPGSRSFFSLIFGKELRYTGDNGTTRRVYRQGYTLEAIDGGSVNVRRRSAADVAALRGALASRGAQRGGSRSRPTNESTARSPVAAINSEAPSYVTTPTSRPVAVQSTEIANVITETDQELLVEQPVRLDDIEKLLIAKAKTPEALPKPKFRARIRISGPSYLLSFNQQVFGNPAARGFTGSPNGTDATVELEQAGGRLVSSDGGQTVDLPDLSGTVGDGGLATISVGNAVLFGIPYSGTAYAGRSDFAAYTLFSQDGRNNPAYLITGTPTDVPALRARDPGTGLRSYSLTRDPVQQSPLPFFNETFYGPPGNFNQTPLLLVEDNGATNEQQQIFYTFTDISGTRSNQRSATLVTTSALFTASSTGTAVYHDGRRGSMRGDAERGVFSFGGGLGTITGPDDNAFFGPNAEHFVIGTAQYGTVDDAFFDTPSNPGANGITGNESGTYTDDPVFGAFHVASLQGETPLATLSRTPRTVRGYATGMVDYRQNGITGQTYRVGSGISGNGASTALSEETNFGVFLNATQNVLTGDMVVVDAGNENPIVSALFLPFGYGTNSIGPNTFVDDDRFAATARRDPQETRIRTDGNSDLPFARTYRPSTYMISGRAAPVAGYQHCTACDYVDWGWWGTRTEADGDGSVSQFQPGDSRSDFVHMGTWVAGDVTQTPDLPLSGVGNFSGTAIGNVSTQGSTQAGYIATGGASMSFDFGTRVGNLTISNFDQDMTASGAVTGPPIGGTGDATFGGSLSGGAVSGDVTGAFVNGNGQVAKGAIGQFRLQDSSRSAIGTLVMGR